MNSSVIRSVAHSSLAGTMKFPDIVKALVQEGVESYHVDLVRSENRYYSAIGETQIETLNFAKKHAAEDFSAEAVQQAVRKSQRGEIGYLQFVDEILAAGCVYYVAYLDGRKVVYFGRKGETHTELMPSQMLVSESPS